MEGTAIRTVEGTRAEGTVIRTAEGTRVRCELRLSPCSAYFPAFQNPAQFAVLKKFRIWNALGPWLSYLALDDSLRSFRLRTFALDSLALGSLALL